MNGKFLLNNNLEKFIGKKTLIYGETNTNKTYYTAKFVQYLIEKKKIPPKEITILDFGPEMIKINDKKIGGRIKDFYKLSKICRNIQFKGKIIPPRLNANNSIELLKNVCENFKKTNSILQQFYKKPTQFLIINDLSIHLHLGNPRIFLRIIKNAQTFFGNSYYGSSIKSNEFKLFSLVEKKKIEFLIQKFDLSIFTR
ncbi:MAG: hypothetical protein ACTSUL_05870 [Promethearchaeota archaeon]